MINLSAPINNLSYGIVGSNIIQSLHNIGKPFLNPIGKIEIPEDINRAAIIESYTRSPYKNSPSVRLYHQFSLMEHIGKGEHIGFPIFELDSFNSKELVNLEYCDSIFVCSKWAKNVVLDHFPNKEIHVVPLGVNRNIFNEEGTVKTEKTIFLNIGKMEYRKGHDVLPEIFNLAFGPKDNIELWMMSDSIFNDPLMYNSMKTEYHQKLAGRIKFLPSVKSSYQVANIIRKADCFISASRAEGWNLPLLESLSCGIMGIATDYSGQTEFTNTQNCLIVNVIEKEKAVDNVWFHGQGNWAKIDNDQVDQFVEHVRHIHKLKQSGQNLLNKNGIETAKVFSWEKTAERIMSIC
jgi:glycosyltransferase involved in cell wall biosynthesis